MKSLRLYTKNDLRYEEVSPPELKSNEVLIRIGACGICGSDIARILYKEPTIPKLIPGHEFAGIVTAVSDNVSDILIGKRVCVFPLMPCHKCVMCKAGKYAQCKNYQYLGSRNNGGLAEFVAAPEWNVLEIPDSLTIEEAALTEPVAVSIHALRLGQVTLGDTVAIFGIGFIGLVLAQLAKNSGAKQVILIDINEERLRFAKELGFEAAINAKDTNVCEEIERLTLKRGCHVIFEGTGTADALEKCIRSTRNQGKVVLVGNPSGGISLSETTYSQILRKELTLHGSWNSSYADVLRSDWETAIEQMSSGEIDVSSLITHRFFLEDYQKALDLLKGMGGCYIKILLKSHSNLL